MLRPRAVLLAGLLLVFATTMGATYGQAQEEDSSSAALRVEWKEFRKLYDAKAIELIDVRGDIVFESGHIPGARSIPLDQIGKHAAELRRARKPVVLYCA
jgi:3-mercaptopyruvate sulfurtransferase SseA